MSSWVLAYDGFDPPGERLREALCTLGNGYFATRGAAPEAAADDVHYPGTYAAGCYNRLTSRVAGREVENEDLVNLPNWLPLTFRPEGGRWLDLTGQELLAYRQELDLRRGVLTRQLRVRGPGRPGHRGDPAPLRLHGRPAPGRPGDDSRARELVRDPGDPVGPGRPRDQRRRRALPGPRRPPPGLGRGR